MTFSTPMSSWKERSVVTRNPGAAHRTCRERRLGVARNAEVVDKPEEGLCFPGVPTRRECSKCGGKEWVFSDGRLHRCECVIKRAIRRKLFEDGFGLVDHVWVGTGMPELFEKCTAEHECVNLAVVGSREDRRKFFVNMGFMFIGKDYRVRYLSNVEEILELTSDKKRMAFGASELEAVRKYVELVIVDFVDDREFRRNWKARNALLGIFCDRGWSRKATWFGADTASQFTPWDELSAAVFHRIPTNRRIRIIHFVGTDLKLGLWGQGKDYWEPGK
jgi:hypothetical protein